MRLKRDGTRGTGARVEEQAQGMELEEQARGPKLCLSRAPVPHARAVCPYCMPVQYARAVCLCPMFVEYVCAIWHTYRRARSLQALRLVEASLPVYCGGITPCQATPPTCLPVLLQRASVSASVSASTFLADTDTETDTDTDTATETDINVRPSIGKRGRCC